MRKLYIASLIIMLALMATLANIAFALPVPVTDIDVAEDVQNQLQLSEDIVLKGLGTQTNPYVISNAKEYNALQAKVSSGENECYVQLGDDIDFGGALIQPIGTKQTPFMGCFDGNGKTLNNFKLDADEYVGVFGFTDKAQIKNLFVGTYTVDLTNTTVEKVYVGIVAYANNTDISKVCNNNVSLNLVGQTKYVYAGGICGYAESDSKGQINIQNCYNICDITLVNNKGYGYVGGLVGRFVTNSGGYSMINHCYSTGDVSADSYNSANVGGLVGYLYSHGSAYSPEVGKLSADQDIMIKNSFAASSVYSSSSAYSSRAGKICGNVNTYAACETATTFYSNDSSFSLTGTQTRVGTQTDLSNLQNHNFISSKMGFDFVSLWQMDGTSLNKYPSFAETAVSFEADENDDFFAVSTDCTVKSNGNVVTIEKLRFANNHKLTLDRGTYVIGEIEGVPNIVADVHANIIIGGNNKPNNYVELDIGNAASPENLRYAEISGMQYEIKAAGNKYGLVANDTLLVEIVEKQNVNTAVSKSKYFIANADGTFKNVTELDDYMTGTDTYGIRLVGNMGIRFKAQIDVNKKNESENFEIVEYGYILTLRKHLDAKEGSQLNFDFDRKVSGVAYNAADGTDLVFSTDNGIDAFTAVLYDIPKTGYKEYVVAKTYTKVSVDGKEYIVYGEEMTSSLYEVAKLVDYDNLNSEHKTVIDEILKA